MPGSDDPIDKANIRHFLGHLVGKRIVDITQDDQEYFKEHGEGFIQIMLEGGDYIKFKSQVDSGFWYTVDGSDEY